MIPSGRRDMPVRSPTSAALPKRFKWVGFPRIYPQRDFMRDEFRDRRYSLRSGLPVCSPPRSPLPLRREGRRAAVTFPPEQLTPRYRCVHRVGEYADLGVEPPRLPVTRADSVGIFHPDLT